jgi:hypothetical protein
MKTPKRPDSVPSEAVWIAEENEWQIGTEMRGNSAPRGECKVWREDGSLAGTHTLDDKGRLHGVNTRYHPDGTVASRGEWSEGERAGAFMFQQSEKATPEAYEGTDRTWRYEFIGDGYDQNDERWFAKDGTPITSDGRPLATAFDMDAVVQISSPESYLERHAAACFQAFHGREPVSYKHAQAMSEFWGVDLSEFAYFTQSLLGFNAIGIREFEGNCWEKLIPHQWGNTHEELSAIFVGAVEFGSIGDSNQLYATLFNPLRPKPRPNAVYFWDHELYYLEEVVALSLDDFAFADAVHTAHEAERLSDDVACDAWQKLKDKVTLPWGLQSGLELLSERQVLSQDDVRKAYMRDIDTDGYVRSYYWRAQWLTRLLMPDGERNFDDVKESFDASRNKALAGPDYDDVLRTGEGVAPTALYLLWRLFWTNDARLKQTSARFANHEARVVRDLVDLLTRFENGLKGIEGLEDVQATREQFLQLRLFETQT